MSRSRGRGKSKFRSCFYAYLGDELNSRPSVPGSKIAKQAMNGVCTIRNLSAAMIFFYNKRFSLNRFAIKVM